MVYLPVQALAYTKDMAQKFAQGLFSFFLPLPHLRNLGYLRLPTPVIFELAAHKLTTAVVSLRWEGWVAHFLFC